MKTALITGATGFIGSHVARALRANGWKVHGLVRSLPDSKCGLDVACFPDEEGFPLKEIFEGMIGPDAVVHVATNPGKWGEQDSQALEDNVLFPARLLEETIARRVPLFVNTDTCIPAQYPALRAYALSKSYFLKWGKAMRVGTDTRFVNVRLCQPYGTGMRSKLFVPSIIRQCIESSGEIALTSGVQLRDFVHVSDVARAFLAVLESQNADTVRPTFESLDCGSGLSISIREFVELVHCMTRSRATLRFGVLPTREGEFSWQADTSALQALGWSPRVPLVKGLRKTLRDDFGVEA